MKVSRDGGEHLDGRAGTAAGSLRRDRHRSGPSRPDDGRRPGSRCSSRPTAARRGATCRGTARPDRCIPLRPDQPLRPPRLFRRHQRGHLAVATTAGQRGPRRRAGLPVAGHPLVLGRLAGQRRSDGPLLRRSQPRRGGPFRRRGVQVVDRGDTWSQRHGPRHQHGHRARGPVGPQPHRPVPVGA